MPEKKAKKKVASSGRAGTASKKTTQRAAPKKTTQRAAPKKTTRRRPGKANRPLAIPEWELLELPQPVRGDAINLGPIAGTGSPTGALGAGGTDLCEISPGGLVALAGDTFAGNGAFQGAWSPSMGLHVRPGTLNRRIQFDRSFGGNGTLYAETWPHVPGGSQLPAGTVQVFGVDYAFVARVADLHPRDTRLVRIDPNGGGWPTVPGSREGRRLAGLQPNTNQWLPRARRLGVYRRRRVRPRSQGVALSVPGGELHRPELVARLGNDWRWPRLGLGCGPDTAER